MCNARSREMIRSQDQVGVPIALNMNSKSTHQTLLGGCCSICAVVLTLIVLSSTMMEVFVNLNIEQTVNMNYIRYNDGHDPYLVSTDMLVPAIQLINFTRPNTTTNIADYAMGFG